MLPFSDLRIDLFRQFIEYRTACNIWNDGYEQNLLCFDRFCLANYPGICGITQEMIDSWCMQRDTENKTSFINRTLPARKLLEYLNQRNLADIKISEMPSLPPKNHIPHSFSADELDRFFCKCDELVKKAKTPVKKFYALQVAVIFRLLYSSGIRTTEVRLLRMIDVDLEHGVLNIRKTKNSIEHYVALHDSACQMLKDYNNVAVQFYPDRELFFPCKGDGPFSACTLGYEFRKVWDPVNTENAVPYDLRHNYAIQNINSWISLGFDFNDKFLFLSKSMGHTSLESTRYYYSLVPALAAILQEKTEQGFNEIVPEVIDCEE